MQTKPTDFRRCVASKENVHLLSISAKQRPAKKKEKERKAQKQSRVDKKGPRKRGSTMTTMLTVLKEPRGVHAFSKHFPRFAFAHADNAALPRTCITTKGSHSPRRTTATPPAARFFSSFCFGTRVSCSLRHALIFCLAFVERASLLPPLLSVACLSNHLWSALCARDNFLTCLVARFAASSPGSCGEPLEEVASVEAAVSSWMAESGASMTIVKNGGKRGTAWCLTSL